MRILTVGDVVGKPGREIVRKQLKGLIAARKVDCCIVNGENVAGGSGMTAALVADLLEAGADVLTSGDHIFKKKEIYATLEKESRLIRPANYPRESAGRGFTVVEAANSCKVAVMCLQGRVFMGPNDCPFHAADRLLAEIREKAKVIVLDMHAEATSEKVAMGWHLDGRVSCVFGTHTHIQTADERILPKGTGYITDVGMTGPYDSIIGREVEPVLATFTTGMPHQFDVARAGVRLCGALFSVDTNTGRCLSVERIRVEME